jgi:mannose-6-phosphate isomerase-like protein (cupin superfamily)
MTLPKKVNKPWGNELWIADGQSTPYALKKIFFSAGKQTSMQVHRRKFETNFVLDGTGIFLLSQDTFDIGRYLAGGITDQEIADFVGSMQSLPLEPGISYNVAPGYVHRVIAVTDLTFIEASTCELDDVIRLQDDTARPHGKINSEHE